VSGKRPALSGEDRLIARLFKPLAKHPGALALEDDAAFFSPPPGQDLVLTKDAVVAGIHFFAADPADAIARKALRVNLSDLAAKGADPAGFLLALALPSGVDDTWLDEFARGLGDDADTYRCPLLGGDTVSTHGPLTVSITALGTVPAGKMVHRAGARPGDRIFVSGTIGDAALGLKLRESVAAKQFAKLSEKARSHLEQRYLYPQPRNALASAVCDHASAAMDVSDGLVGDLAKLCRVSGVTATLQIADVPLSEAAASAINLEPSLLQTALTGGDDYEILCCVPQSAVPRWLDSAKASGVPVTQIGMIESGQDAPSWIGASGQAVGFGAGSFSHF
jgi:thiamine-monophosphate kinase